MPAYTYQVAINEDGKWVRDYVCAENKYQAVTQWLEEHPMMTLEFLLQSDDLQVERCE